jgi:hypothetical protein
MSRILIENKISSLKSIANRVISTINEADADDELKKILKQNYSSFVKNLGDNIKDSKFLDAIKSLNEKEPIQVSAINVKVTDLQPTQNEVVLDKSLSYPLTDASSAESCLNGGNVAVAGKSIVTGGGGKFVIDGHHRWSQLFCMNPDASILAMDLTDIKKPIEALKATQIGIAAQTGKVPTSPGGGVNLFKIGKNTLRNYVINTITDSVVEVFKKYDKGETPEEIADYIWGNVQTLKKQNKPISGAPKRDVMPQTDDAPEWVDNTFNVEKLPESIVNRFKKLIKYNK